jgi:hypothetical protein
VAEATQRNCQNGIVDKRWHCIGVECGGCVFSVVVVVVVVVEEEEEEEEEGRAKSKPIRTPTVKIRKE